MTHSAWRRSRSDPGPDAARNPRRMCHCFMRLCMGGLVSGLDVGEFQRLPAPARASSNTLPRAPERCTARSAAHGPRQGGDQRGYAPLETHPVTPVRPAGSGIVTKPLCYRARSTAARLRPADRLICLARRVPGIAGEVRGRNGPARWRSCGLACCARSSPSCGLTPRRAGLLPDIGAADDARGIAAEYRWG